MIPVRLTALLLAMLIGLWTAGAIVWWRADQCGRSSAINGKCLIWIDQAGINIVPIPE